MAKKFMYVCFGIMVLFTAYHLGANRAQSQIGGFVSVAVYADHLVALQEDGTLYWSAAVQHGTTEPPPFPEYWHCWGQIPVGSSMTVPTTWGKSKPFIVSNGYCNDHLLRQCHPAVLLFVLFALIDTLSTSRYNLMR